MPEAANRSVRMPKGRSVPLPVANATASRSAFASANSPSSSLIRPTQSPLERYGPNADGLVFTDAKGEPIRRNALGHLWRRAAVKAGVEGFTPHDLRHYAASVLIDQGASVKAVQRHLGHSSATTTLDTYAHLWPDSEDVTRRALEAGVAAIASPVRHDVAAEG